MTDLTSGSRTDVRVGRFAFLLLALLIAACKGPPPHEYSPESDVRYSPEQGFYRVGSQPDLDEDQLFRNGVRAFNERDYKSAVESFKALRLDPRWVDGARAPQAVILESFALLERGRPDHPGWLVNDLVNAYFFADENREPDPSRDFRRIPSYLMGEKGFEEIQTLANHLSDRDAIKASWKVTRDVFEYYGAAFGIQPSLFADLSRHARNLAWLAFLADDDTLAEDICRDLLKRGLRGWVSARIEIIFARTLKSQGARIAAADAYKRAAVATRIPAIIEEALLGEVQSLIDSSKGWNYDKGVYEQALRKINEYKANFLVRHGRIARHVKHFSALEKKANEALYKQLLEAARTYEKLSKDNAAALYRKKAAAFLELSRKQELRLEGLSEAAEQ